MTEDPIMAEESAHDSRERKGNPENCQDKVEQPIRNRYRFVPEEWTTSTIPNIFK